MILTCPQCTARFLVADSAVPREGRMVRCGACSNQWHVTHPAPEAIMVDDSSLDAPTAADATFEAMLAAAPEIKPLAPGANVPAIKRRKIPVRPLMIAAPVLLCTWFALAMLAYFPSWQNAPLLGAIYRSMGVTETQGLAFVDVKMEREESDTKTRFIFSGNIVNHADVTRTVPIVHVALNDKAGKSVWGRDYPVHVELKPGEIYPFRIVNVETSFAGNVATIVLDLGHPLSLMMR